MFREQCLLRCGWCLCDIYSRCSVWFPPFQHKFQLFITQRCTICWKFPVSHKSPDKHSVLTDVIPLKSLITAEYTKAFRYPHSQKSRGLRSGDYAGQLTGPPHPIRCSPKVWFRYCLTMGRKLGGAPSCMNHMLLMKRHKFQECW
jgi:hypothetical protein